MPRAFDASARDCLSPRRAGASLTRCLGPSGLVLALAAIAAAPVLAAVPPNMLYGSGGTAIVTFDQKNGSITSLAPQSVRFAGLAFDSTGRLFATGCTDDPTCSNYVSESVLLELDPVTGAILDTIGPVTDLAGSRPAILALAVQPGTDVLYGFGYLGSSPTRIWTIDPATAVATPIASEVPAGCEPPACSHDVGFDFAPDGTRYHGTRYPVPGPSSPRSIRRQGSGPTWARTRESEAAISPSPRSSSPRSTSTSSPAARSTRCTR